jgi:fermentation-respiration switch protein FrsA (DUF1100 family)
MILFYLILIAIFLYLVACSLFYFFQHKVLFKQTKFAQNYPYHYDYPFEELFWKTEDGESLNGLLFTVKNPKGLILFLHGNSGHMARSGNYFKRVKDLKYDVLLYDYRGYGKSTGKASTHSFYTDALQIFDWAQEKYPTLPIVIHGLSLGSHIACYVASKRAIRFLIMETPFLNLAAIASYRFPLIPGKHLLRYPLNSADYLPLITCPIHVFHGDKDSIVPLSEALKIPLYNPNVIFTIIKNGDHKNLHDFEEYQQTLEKILRNI